VLLSTRRLKSAVYDAGALLAAERGDRDFLAIHVTLLRQGRSVVVPSPVLTQVWHSGRRATLSRVLNACIVQPASEDAAKSAGDILRRARCSDAVGAIVVATAIEHDALVVTSDPDDIGILWGASGDPSKLPSILAV
jgi:predicted nucleic acid-binding protein